MGQLRENNEITAAEQSNLDISELINLFDVSTLKLSQCAKHTHGDDEGLDEATAETQIKYMTLQDQTIEAAVKLPIESPADIKNLLRLWLKEQASYGDDIRRSDALILNLCAYYKLG